jgi:hypothetical protein
MFQINIIYKNVKLQEQHKIYEHYINKNTYQSNKKY